MKAREIMIEDLIMSSKCLVIQDNETWIRLWMEHWGAHVSFRSGFLGVYAQKCYC